jgi:HAD superfamily hydrolase (TIGR01509 family)
MLLEAIFFDAGNTLVFPDRKLTLAPLLSRGIEPAQEQLWAAERVARKQRDKAALAGNQRLGDADYWTIYYRELFRVLAAGEAETTSLSGDSQLLDELIACARKAANWNVVREGTREALLEMKRSYRLAVISNSDGSMADLITRLGLGDCFEQVIDSGKVGVEKPDPRIFQIAAQAIGIEPANSLYVGDVYSIDYAGAKVAGFDAVLFDVCGAYKDDGLARVESLQQLREWLARMESK